MAEKKLPSYLSGTLEQKYRIEKRNGHLVDPDAKYFVLRYDKDPNAVVAVIAYAASITGDNSRFANDLLRAVYIHAKRMGKLEEWADAAIDLLVRGKMPQEEKQRAEAMAQVDARYKRDGAPDTRSFH